MITLQLTGSEAEQTENALLRYEQHLHKEYGALPLVQDDMRDVASVLSKINETKEHWHVS